MFIDPALRDLFQRCGVQVMKLLATAPERDNQLGLDEQVNMLANALSGYVEMSAKLVQSLAVVLAELIQ